MINITDKALERIAELQEDLKIIDADLISKYRRHDSHGVRDAVVDTEILEAKIAAFREVLTWISKR